MMSKFFIGLFLGPYSAFLGNFIKIRSSLSTDLTPAGT